jgi:hypothetical protein
MKRRKRSRAEIHARLMRTDPTYRRLAELVDARRGDEEREALPLGSEAFSRDVTRRLKARLASYDERRREAS